VWSVCLASGFIDECRDTWQVIKLKERTVGRLRTALAVVAILAVLALASGYLVITGEESSQQSPPNQSECYVSVEGYAVYVRVVSDDSGRPIAGADVSGIEENVCGPSHRSYITYSQTINAVPTPANGTVILSAAFEQYNVTVGYSSSTYSFTLNLAPMKILNATLYVPSGRLNTTIYSP
jgi:hypothetical protein